MYSRFKKSSRRASPKGLMKAIVLFDTRYGNTERIARSLETGLQKSGLQTACINVKDAVVDSLGEYDLICLGGPTHHRAASAAMQGFLHSLKGADLSGKLAFVFDTRRDSFLAGSAAKFIEGRLQKLGLKMVKPSLSASIFNPTPDEKRRKSESKDEWKERRHRSERLLEDMELQFESLGREIGRTIDC